MQHATVSDWQSAIRGAAGHSGKMSRRVTYDAALALLRAGVEGHEETAQAANVSPAVSYFLTTLRSIQLRSLGVHIVDPIVGRLSTIWTHDESPSASSLARAELYAHVWNRIYRRLFHPSATLINAIESGVLPWQWNNIFLPTTCGANNNHDVLFNDPFFRDTKILASNLERIITDCLPASPDPSSRQHVEAAVQSIRNELEKSDFVLKLDRIATRFRDQIIDDEQKKEMFCEYLRECSSGELPPDLEDSMDDKTEKWGIVLDIIQAIQSSILSQPMFCDETGLWVHRSEFSNSPLVNRTSIYIVFGLVKYSLQDKDLYEIVKTQFDSLGKAIDSLIEVSTPIVPERSDLVRSIFDEVRRQGVGVQYHETGLRRWLSVIEKLANEAKHEGHQITYNLGYGSLAYAQAHLHAYEVCPDDLATDNAPIEKIASYIKGFYSIFGKRPDRGLWFDELGRYCGVYESADGRMFEKTMLAKGVQSKHKDTLLFAKIGGVGLVDILDRKNNRISRVKHGKLVDMVRGDIRRKKAIEVLSLRVFPADLVKVADWLVNELIELLQTETHGTSFIISSPISLERNASRDWVIGIEEQAKALTRDFRQLEAPLATKRQLTDYAESGRRPEHLFKFLAELSNLDGGLWLHLSDEGLEVKAAQRFTPLLNQSNIGFRLFDLAKVHGSADAQFLPASPVELFDSRNGLKSLFVATNGGLDLARFAVKKKYVESLSFLDHSGTKTHSLWGMSVTASEPCLCVVISSDGNTYIFHDGRELIGVMDA